MALLERIAKVRAVIDATGDFREWKVTASVLDTPQGNSVTLTCEETTGGAVPPSPADVTRYEVKVDTGTTTIKQFFVPSSVQTFWFTSDGASSGNPRPGTLRLRVFVQRTDPISSNIEYRINSDNDSDGGAQVIPVGWSIQRDVGWIRGTIPNASATISNVAYAGAKNQPAEFLESLFLELTLSNRPYLNTWQVRQGVGAILTGGLVVPTLYGEPTTFRNTFASGTGR